MTQCYLNDRQAAEYIGVTPSCLRTWRWNGKGPRFIKISSKCVRYSIQDLRAFMEKQGRLSTSDVDGEAARAAALESSR